MIIEVN